MVADSSLGTICSASSPYDTPTDDESFWLDHVCLTLYWAWLMVVVGVMTTEWLMRDRRLPATARRTSQGAQSLARTSSGLTQGRFFSWVIWLPLAVGVPSSILTISWVLSTPRSFAAYTKSQATIDFLESCSDPTATNLTSHAAYQVFFFACDTVQNRMNADIGGIGIRISLYVSFLVTIFSSFLGHFHQEKTVVKDIGTAQLTSMLSLAFALLRSYTALTFWQLMVAVMSLEVTSATVQMALSQKETLASRWWVVLNSASQLFVQASLAIVIGVSFPMSPAQQDPCQPCVRAVWWGTFDACKQVPWTFWIYWSMRTLIALRSCAIGLHHMHFYDLSERVAKGEKSTTKISRSSSLLQRLTLTDPMKSTTMIDSQTARTTNSWSLQAFPRMPATTLTDWILWILPAGVAISSMERMLSLFDLSKPGSITDWGQTTTFMAVILGLVARSIYLFYAKLKCRSCLERTKSAMELSKSSIAWKNNLAAEDFSTLESKWKSFQDIRKVLEPVDCVRKRLPDHVWYEHIDLEKIEAEFLRSAAFNDVNGLIEFANYIPDLSTAVDDMKRTALHIALDKNNIEAIETIMELVDREPLPGDLSTNPGKNFEKLLNTEDKTGRTPRRMIMPNVLNQMNMDVLEAFLRFKHPVKHPDECTSVAQKINMIFTLSYSLTILKNWVQAAEDTQSLSQLENDIVQAVEIDNRTQTKEIEQVTKAVFEFCCWQNDEMGRTEFADRLFETFVYSPLRSSVSMPARIALRLVKFVQERRVWAVKAYTEIARIIAWKCEESSQPIQLLLEQQPKDMHIEEQIVVGVVSNGHLGNKIMYMMWQKWPDQVAVTPKVLEECLVNDLVVGSSYLHCLLLKKRPHEVQVTDSILKYLAQHQDMFAWELLLEEYRSQINMTQDIFQSMVRTYRGSQNVADLFEVILEEWPDETRITNEILLTFMQTPEIGVESLEVFFKVRHDELGSAIDSKVLVSLAEHRSSEENGRYGFPPRTTVDFLFQEYPKECKASITDEVLKTLKNMTGGHSVVHYFEAYQQGWSIVRWGNSNRKQEFYDIDLSKTSEEEPPIRYMGKM